MVSNSLPSHSIGNAVPVKYDAKALIKPLSANSSSSSSDSTIDSIVSLNYVKKSLADSICDLISFFFSSVVSSEFKVVSIFLIFEVNTL